MKHAEEHLLQSNLKKTDVIFYYTTVSAGNFTHLFLQRLRNSTAINIDPVFVCLAS